MPAFAEFAVDSQFASRASNEDAEGVRFRIPFPRPEYDGSDAVQVLLVGCGPALLSHLSRRLLPSHWVLREAATGAAALHLLEQQASDIVLVAPALPDLDAPELRQLLKTRFPGVQVFDLHDFTATERQGSSVPGELLQLHGDSSAASSPNTFSGRLPSGRGEDAPPNQWQGIVGAAPAMQQVFRTAALVARRNTTVLIGGESGTGKDLLARAIHNASPRARQPFVVINCAAIPESLLEAELFGHAKGAFTGASQSRAGRVHAAHGGTLFLDEIGDMPLPLQSKILRFLEQGEVQRIGGTETLKVDCRFVAATNADLQQQVKARQFREDLYYRLAVMPIAMPPLRERMSDLPALSKGFLDRFSPGTHLHPESLELLMQHRWPGNVRELRNVMERASLFADGRHEILADDVVF